MDKYTEIIDTNREQMLQDVQSIRDKFEDGESMMVFSIKNNPENNMHTCSSAGVLKSGHIVSFLDTAIEVTYATLNDLAKVDVRAALEMLDEVKRVLEEWS